jgi:hypothetical protein
MCLVPQWMCDEKACQKIELTNHPHLDIQTLFELKMLLDGLKIAKL